jgi:hypothetical protein
VRVSERTASLAWENRKAFPCFEDGVRQNRKRSTDPVRIDMAEPVSLILTFYSNMILYITRITLLLVLYIAL